MGLVVDGRLVGALAAIWLAMGCGAEARRAAEYREESAELRCELESTCAALGGSGGWVCPDVEREADRCDVLDEEAAAACLDALEDLLEGAKAGSCPDDLTPDPCQDALSRRERDGCNPIY